MPKERLDKILASQNLGSRREVGTMIRHGAVTVNGVPARRAEEKADPETDVIAVSGKQISFKRYLYIMMNKPAGVLSAARDSRARTVVDLLPPELLRRGLFPAGRLDKDTRGLLIITDDGDFAHKLLAPKSHVYKWYEADLDACVTEEDIRAFSDGIMLREMQCLPAEMKLLNREGTKALVKIREGKFHQVKRMFAARGKTVLGLKRIRIGDLELDQNLEEGAARELTDQEKERLFIPYME